MGLLLVEHEDAGGNAGAVEEIRRQADDALDVAALHDLLADVGLGPATKEHAMRENDRAFAGALEASEDVQQKGVVAVLHGRNAELKSMELVLGRIESVAPGFGRERRIGDDEVEGLERAGLGVLEVRAGETVVLPDIRRGAVMKDHVHLGERLGGVVHLLPVEREIKPAAFLRLIVRLEEQGAGAARRVVDGLSG